MAKPEVAAMPRALTMKEMIAVVNALEAYFDVKSGMYAGGYSDDKIASECDVPRACVEKVRREGYGELKMPDEIQAVATTLGEIRARHKALTADLAALSGRIDAVDTKINEYRARHR